MTQLDDGPVTRGQVVGAIATALVAVSLSIGFAYLFLNDAGGDPSRPASAVPGSTKSPRPEASRPASGLERALRLRSFFGHQSVGANIIDGVPNALRSQGLPTLAIASPRDGLATTGPLLIHTAIGENGDPLGKIADFASKLREGVGADVDVAIMKLCYVDFGASTDVKDLFRAYASTMDALEAEFPNVRFLYATAPVTASPTPGTSSDSSKVTGLLHVDRAGMPVSAVREKYNALVRERYGESGRLFDIAALEASMGGGHAMALEFDGHLYYSMNPALASSDREHLNREGSRQLAQELLMLIGAGMPR